MHYHTLTIGDSSPWGTIDSLVKLEEGAYMVSTDAHGGIMVDYDLARHLFTFEARKQGYSYCNWLCYEEDVEVSIVLYEQPSWAPTRTEQQRRDAEMILQREYPDYVFSLLTDEQKAAFTAYCRAHEQSMRHPNTSSGDNQERVQDALARCRASGIEPEYILSTNPDDWGSYIYHLLF